LLNALEQRDAGAARDNLALIAANLAPGRLVSLAVTCMYHFR
jgi:hypothetical protein